MAGSHCGKLGVGSKRRCWRVGVLFPGGQSVDLMKQVTLGKAILSVNV